MKPKDEEKFEKIAHATFTLVERSGLSGLTMAEIAKTAKIATGTLYLYYPSKEELIQHLYERAKLATAARVDASLDPNAPYRSRFRQIWRALLDERLEHYAQAVFQEQYMNSQWYSGRSQEVSAKVSAKWLQFLEEGKQLEVLKQIASPLLAAAVLGSVRETARLVRHQTIQADAATLDAAFSLCWDGVKA